MVEINICSPKIRVDGGYYDYVRGVCAQKSKSQRDESSYTALRTVGEILGAILTGGGAYGCGGEKPDCIGNDCVSPQEAMCDSGQRKKYYDGSPSTKGIGICKAGIKECRDGVWEVIEYQVLPQFEACNDGLDNDCDGLVDGEDEFCAPPPECVRDYFLYNGKCCTAGEMGGLLCIVDSFDFPHVWGLAWDDRHLWAVAGGKIYKLTTEGQIIDSFDAPGRSPFGLTWGIRHLWNANTDHRNNDVKIYRLTAEGQVVGSFDAPGTFPVGLTWDGAGLWNSDKDTDKIYRINTSGEVMTSFNSPWSTPTGLAWDGRHLWHADWGEGRAGCGFYKLTTMGEVINFFQCPNVPNGLTWDGRFLWCSAATVELGSKIYKLEVIEE